MAQTIPKATVIGTVWEDRNLNGVFDNGEALPGVSVTHNGGPAVPGDVTAGGTALMTDSSGLFTIEFVQEGTYDINFYLDGYVQPEEQLWPTSIGYQYEVEVFYNPEVSINVRLEKEQYSVAEEFATTVLGCTLGFISAVPLADTALVGFPKAAGMKLDFMEAESRRANGDIDGAVLKEALVAADFLLFALSTDTSDGFTEMFNCVEGLLHTAINIVCDGGGLTCLIQKLDELQLDYTDSEVEVLAPIFDEDLAPTITNYHYSTTTGSNIFVSFSEDMDDTTFTLPAITVSGSSSGDHSLALTFDHNTYELEINPASDFSYGETVTVTIGTGVKDLVGNSLASQYQFSFNIQDAPGADPTSLNVSATITPGSNVPAYSIININGTTTYNTGDNVLVGTAVINTGDNLYTASVNNGVFNQNVYAPGSSGNISITVNEGEYGLSKTIYVHIDIQGDEGGSGYDLVSCDMIYDKESSSDGAQWWSKDAFKATDNYVEALVYFEDVYQSLDVRYEFYKPDGTQYGGDLYSHVPHPADSGWEWWNWYWVSYGWLINGNSMSSSPGLYSAKVYIDDGSGYKLRSTKFFSIQYHYTEHKMCKGVQGSSPYDSINPTNTFYQNDTNAYTWANFDWVAEGHDVKWEWYEPNGSLYTTTNFTMTDPADNGHVQWNWYRTWANININGNSAQSKCGDWQVKVYVQNAANSNWDQAYTDNFQILESPVQKPSITVTANPSSPIEGQLITLSLDATDNTYLDTVELHWKIDGIEQTPQISPNINTGQKNLTHDIGSFNETQQIEFWGVAVDTSGNHTESQRNTIIMPIDTTGPIVSNLTPSKSAIVEGVDTAITISATVDDSTTGNSNIAGAEYYIGNIDPGVGNGTSLSPVDIFDTPVEDVQAAIDTSSWTAANSPYTINVRGRDAQGNWGNIQSVSITAFPSGSTCYEPNDFCSGWDVCDGSESGNPPTCQSGVVKVGSGSLVVSRDNRCWKTLPIPSQGTVEFTAWAYPATDSNTNFSIALGDSNVSNSAIILRINETNRWFIGSGEVVANYSMDWTKIKILINTGQSTFSVWLDDVLVAQDKSAQASISGGIDSFGLHSGRGGDPHNSYIDDIRICNIGGDNDGPIVSNLTSSKPAIVEAVDTTITISATVDDTTTGNSSIAGAEYYIGNSDPGVGHGTVMTPADGTLDSPTETAQITIDTSSWTAANSPYTINVRGRDAQGNWSNTQSVSITVDLSTCYEPNDFCSGWDVCNGPESGNPPTCQSGVVKVDSGSLLVSRDNTCWKTLPTPQNGSVEFTAWAYPATDSNTNFSIRLGDSNVSKESIILRINETNTWFVGNEAVANYSMDWTKVRILINTAQSTFSVWLDDTLVAGVKPAQASISGGIDSFGLHSGRGGNPHNSYIDDIRICSIGGDNDGPIVSSLTSSKPAIVEGVDTAITISATVDDSTTGNSNIAGTEYYIGNIDPGVGNGIPLDPVDIFDSSVEDVQAAIDTTSWTVANSPYTVYVRCQDAQGNWGNIQSVSIEIAAVEPEPDDTDGDGIPDVQDAFPNDPNEWLDTDEDGIGNNADTDDDNDGIPDEWEVMYGLNPLIDDSSGDIDGDGTSNYDEYMMSVYGIAESWTSKTPMPTHRYGAASAAVNGKIYVIGGYDNILNAELNMVEEYDPTKDYNGSPVNPWTTRSPMPTPRYNVSAAVVNDIIYVIGGTPTLQVVEAYNPVSDSWTTKSSLPSGRGRNHYGIGVVNDKIYIAGGWNGSTWSTMVDEFDPVTNVWTPKTSMSTQRTGPASAVANGKFYVIGGHMPSTTNAVEEYNPSTDTWITKTAMPSAREGATGNTINGKIYVIGGSHNSGPPTPFYDLVEKYDPTKDYIGSPDNPWTTVKPMITARSYTTSAVLNSKIYVFGGYDYSALNIVEEYTPVLSEGLVAYYPFNGNADDLSGNANDGVVNGATLTADRFNNPNRAYSFDGVDDEINLSSEIPATTGDGTWSAWVRPINSNASGVVMGKNGLTVGYMLYLAGQQRIFTGAGSSTSQVYWDSFTPNIVGNWNHMLIVKSGSTLTLYLNSVNQGSRSMAQVTPIASIGVGESGSLRFEGSIDDVLIYGRALSAVEIQQLYNDTKPTDIDDDGDGIENLADNCPNTAPGESVDVNGCSATQLDDDNDGVNNTLDLCPGTPTGEAVDAIGCSATQPDIDGDGVDNAIDNCPGSSNPGQEDIDGDGIGDTCEGVVEVDFNAPAGGDGTPASPFNNLTNAVNAVDVGGTIYIKGGTIPGPFTISKPMIIRSSDGNTVIIGQ